MILKIYILSITISILMLGYEHFFDKSEKTQQNKKKLKESIEGVRYMYGEQIYYFALTFIVVVCVTFSPAVVFHSVFKKLTS